MQVSGIPESWSRLDRHVVVSSDCHAGAQMETYREYLDSSWHDEFDAWAAAYTNPWEQFDRNESGVRAGMSAGTLESNWDSTLRQRSLEADGISGEVIFPNTVPPFFPSGTNGLVARNPSRDDYEHRKVGLRAHNRWLVDFCAELPGRRAAQAQFLLNDIDDAVAELRSIKKSGLPGGVMLPSVAPGDGLPELFDPVYEPVWSVCEELDIVLSNHGGSGPLFVSSGPDMLPMMFIESRLWSHRPLWHLIFSGVFERHPNLQFVLTEQGTGWVTPYLDTLDYFANRMHVPGSTDWLYGRDAVSKLSLLPSEYFARQCHIGASLFTPAEAAVRDKIGAEKIMWGSDFPHSEGSYPFSKEALRLSFWDVPVEETRMMVGAAAAQLYGLDCDALAQAASRIGPSVEETNVPLTDIPDPARRITTFDPHDLARAW
jgi:predicted TIM-barrel fold metal-dependent hydrolase